MQCKGKPRDQGPTVCNNASQWHLALTLRPNPYRIVHLPISTRRSRNLLTWHVTVPLHDLQPTPPPTRNQGAAPTSGIAEFLDPMHIRKFYPETILSQPASATALAALPSLRCVRLASILEAHSVQHVNFFVLDVEGAELAGVLPPAPRLPCAVP